MSEVHMLKDGKPVPSPVFWKGPPKKQYEGKTWGEVERDKHGARIIYWQEFPRDKVTVKFFDRKGKRIDPDKGDDIWSHCWIASVPCIPEHAIAYVVLRKKIGFILSLDYSERPHTIKLPGILTLADFTTVVVGYHNMEMRGSPPPWMPGAVQPT